MGSPKDVDTENPAAVAEALKVFFADSVGDGSAVIERAVADVEKMFKGERQGYQAIDMEYHDLDHTFK